MNKRKLITDVPTYRSHVFLSSLYTSIVIPAGMRVSSAMDGKLEYVLVVLIPAIHAGMTNGIKDVYKDEEECSARPQWLKRD